MRRDFENYLTQVQKQVNQMNGVIEKVNQQIKDGMLKEEECKTLREQYEIVLRNYNSLLYCRYLFNMPPRFIQWLQKKKLAHELKKFKEQEVDQESVVKENEEAIDEIKEISENAN